MKDRLQDLLSHNNHYFIALYGEGDGAGAKEKRKQARKAERQQAFWSN